MSHREYHRSDRVAALFRRELAVMVHELVRDHALASVSVSDVEVTRDLAHAKVFVTALMSEHAKPAVKVLNENAGEFRRRLGKMLRMRIIPELHFHYDASVDQGERIDALLRGVQPSD